MSFRKFYLALFTTPTDFVSVLFSMESYCDPNLEGWPQNNCVTNKKLPFKINFLSSLRCIALFHSTLPAHIVQTKKVKLIKTQSQCGATSQGEKLFQYQSLRTVHYNELRFEGEVRKILTRGLSSLLALLWRSIIRKRW